MGKFVDLTKIAIIEIFFGDLGDKCEQLWLIFREDRPEQTAIAIFHHHPLLQLVRIGTNSETAFTVAAEGSKPQGNVQRRKLVAGGEQGMNIQALDLRAVDDQVRDLNQQLA